jgi:hypothetical protein
MSTAAYLLAVSLGTLIAALVIVTLAHLLPCGAWGPWVDLGVPMASSPSAVSWSNARTDVVHLNSSGNLIHTYWSP